MPETFDGKRSRKRERKRLKLVVKYVRERNREKGLRGREFLKKREQNLKDIV